MNKKSSNWIKTEKGFVPQNGEIFESIPSALYDAYYDYELGEVALRKIEFQEKSVFMGFDPKHQKVIDHIQQFWEQKEVYTKYKLTYKRGILMYGPHGSGKSTILKHICDNFIKQNGLALIVDNSITNQIRLFKSFIENAKKIEPERKFTIIIEEVEEILYNRERDFLDLMDGIEKMDNILYIFSTNHIEKIPARFLNRPGRIDMECFVGYPEAQIRKDFIKHLCKELDKPILEKDLNKLTKHTNNLSMAQIKEAFIRINIFNFPYDEVIKDMKKLIGESYTPDEMDDIEYVKGQIEDTLNEETFDVSKNTHYKQDKKSKKSKKIKATLGAVLKLS